MATNSYYFRSTDNGNTWVKEYFPNPDIYEYYLVFGNNVFFALSSTGSKGYVSSTGVSGSWTEVSIPLSISPKNNSIIGPVFYDGLFYIFKGGSNEYITSSNAINWTSRTFPVNIDSGTKIMY